MSEHRVTEPLFYYGAIEGAGELLLTGEEAHHVTVQRRRVGDAIALFDGRGHVACGTITAIERNRVRVHITERWREPSPTPALDLYCALPKGDRVAVLLDMGTQLGMSRFTPIAWQRSVNAPGERATERWRRICVEACKQSRRLHLPEIGPASAVDVAIRQAKATGARILLAHPGAEAGPWSAIAGGGAARIGLFVGPEGGLTDEEVAMFRKEDAAFVHLGPAILRIETAAIALLAVIRCTAIQPPADAAPS